MDNFKEQEVFFLIALGIVITTTLGFGMVWLYHQTRRKLLQDALTHQKQLLEKTIITQEKERKRIAKDLHDEVGGKLNVAHLYLQQLRQVVNQNKNIVETSDHITTMLNAALAATRRISHDLLPPLLEEFGLERALSELAQAYSQSTALQVEVNVESEQFPIADQMAELNLFRVVQELISNSVKHGEASQIYIFLKNDQTTLHLHYKDDGKGFVPNKSLKSHGLGMKNIESRLQIINGQWSYDSSAGKGFRADLTINSAI